MPRCHTIVGHTTDACGQETIRTHNTAGFQSAQNRTRTSLPKPVREEQAELLELLPAQPSGCDRHRDECCSDSNNYDVALSVYEPNHPEVGFAQQHRRLHDQGLGKGKGKQKRNRGMSGGIGDGRFPRTRRCNNVLNRMRPETQHL